ncbi:hypothetical protein BC332_33857 [Capsicum chinense]|nr:hypothetical protein BC332_33857 [Capsicum chinense]
MQVASHAQKYFKHLKSVPKAKRRETILDIISAYAEATGTTDVVLSTKNERTLPQESINAEQTITVAEGDSAGHGSQVVSSTNYESIVASIMHHCWEYDRSCWGRFFWPESYVIMSTYSTHHLALMTCSWSRRMLTKLGFVLMLQHLYYPVNNHVLLLAVDLTVIVGSVNTPLLDLH